jgi:hypothetical protein
MSAGRFSTVNYQYGDGSLGSIRIQPETATALVIGGVTNEEVAGTRTARRAFVSLGRRRQGVRLARLVRIVFTATPPTGYAAFSVITLPLINNAIYAAAAVEEQVGTYLGVAIRVVGVTPPLT